jgi:hypothetical protein
MSSSFSFRDDHWHVSNMLFWRTLRFMCEVGAERAATDRERAWVHDLAEFVALDMLSADLDVTEFFRSPDEIHFWSTTLYLCAERVYQRTLGSQDDQTWQPVTIWAMVDFANLLSTAHRQLTRTANPGV